MKQFKFKIAVCISGQSRSWEAGLKSFLHYFSSDFHEFYFFGHSWNENSWKVNGGFGLPPTSTIEVLNSFQLRDDLQNAFNTTALQIDSQVKSSTYCWPGAIKSAMIANHLKTKFEIDNNFVFDIVVKTRWDACYRPDKKFEDFLPREVDPMTLYASSFNSFAREYKMPAIDDILYFGSSRTMNIIDSFYHYYISGKFFEMTKTNDYNPAMKNVGIGVLIHRWAALKNIFIQTPPNNFFTPVIVRKSAIDYAWPEEFDKILNAYVGF